MALPKAIGRAGHRAFAFAIVFLISGAMVPVILGDQTEAPLQRYLWIGLYVIAFYFLAKRRGWVRRTWDMLTADKFILAIVVLAVASVFWSTQPATTFKRSIMFGGSTILGVYLASRYSIAEQLRVVAAALATAAILSMLANAFLPSYAFFDDTREMAWRGVFHHKNAFGRAMCLGSLATLLVVATSSSSISRVKYSVSAFVCVAMLFVSSSKTAWAVFLLILALIVFRRFFLAKGYKAVPLTVFVLLTVVGVGTLVVSNADEILARFGRSMTLSGRTILWAAVADLIRERPMLGFGFGGFWSDNLGFYSSNLWADSAHNAYLEWWVNLGLGGLLLFIMSLGLNLRRALILARARLQLIYFWPLAFFTFVLIYAVVESIMSKVYESLFWTLYVMTSYSTAQQLRVRGERDV
ncbi:MAG: O-antigen ligase family protein [Rhodothermia bacterium]|nr:O-antigen ligase family protein [Rhodothermia bacterium]